MAEPATAAPAAASTAAPDAGAAADADYRSQLSSQLAELRGETPEPEPKPNAEADADAAPAEEAAEGDEPGDEDETEAAAGDEPEAEADAPGKYSKALAKLQKREADFAKHRTEVLTKERDVAAREAKLQTTQKNVQSFIEAIKRDPFGTLQKEGLLSQDDVEYIAKQLHYNSAEAAKDPRNRAEADRLRRERERDVENKALRDRVEKVEKEREEERARAAQTAELNQYVSKLDAAVESSKAKTPLLAQALAKNAQKTSRELKAIAHELSVAANDWADPKAVVTEWVKRRRELLSEHGVEEPKPAATTTTKPPSKQSPNQPAERRGPGNEPVNTGSSKTKAPPPNETPEQRAEREQLEYRAKLKRMLKGEDVED